MSLPGKKIPPERAEALCGSIERRCWTTWYPGG